MIDLHNWDRLCLYEVHTEARDSSYTQDSEVQAKTEESS